MASAAVGLPDGIPADNLEAVGYGEQYLLVQTQGPERRNRRVTIRAVGDLLVDVSEVDILQGSATLIAKAIKEKIKQKIERNNLPRQKGKTRKKESKKALDGRIC